MYYTNCFYRPVRRKVKRNFSSGSEGSGSFWKWAAAAAVPAAIMAGKYFLTGDAAGPGDIVSAAAPAEGVTIPGPEIKIDNGLSGGVPLSPGKLTLEDLHPAEGVSRMPPQPQDLGVPPASVGEPTDATPTSGQVRTRWTSPQITRIKRCVPKFPQSETLLPTGKGWTSVPSGNSDVLCVEKVIPVHNMSRSSTRIGNLYGLNFSRYYPRVFSENFATAAGTGVLPVAVAAGPDPQSAPYVAVPMQPNDYQRYPVLTKLGHMAGGMLKGGALGFVPAAAALGAGSVLNNDALFNTGVGIAVGAPIVGGVGGYLYGKALSDYDPYKYLQRKQ